MEGKTAPHQKGERKVPKYVSQNNFDPNWPVCIIQYNYDNVRENIPFFSNTRAAMTAQLGHNFKIETVVVVVNGRLPRTKRVSVWVP